MTEREPRAWHILSGEYPPANGGVADYTRLVARGLAAAAEASGSGETVHVWTPRPADGQALVADAGVHAHALPGAFGPRALRALAAGLDASPGPRRLLVQYVPHAFGMKGMNVPFCAWLASRRDDEIWVMFHEVAYPWRVGQRFNEGVLAATNRAMAAMLVWRADRLFVSVPYWEPYLRTFLPRCPSPTWLPIPSNVPTEVEPGARRRVRDALLVGLGRPAPPDALRPAPEPLIVGHFGTYGDLIGALLASTLLAYTAHTRDHGTERATPPDVLWVMLGRGGPAFVRDRFPDRRDIVAPGALSLEGVAEHLAACDVVLQPYVDGVSARRTSAMAGLALGVPLVTNAAECTEPEWRKGAVALADRPDPEALAQKLLEVLAIVRDPARAAALSAAGRSLYDSEFSLERTMRTLHQNLPDPS